MMNVNDVLFSRIYRFEEDTTYHRLCWDGMFWICLSYRMQRNSSAISIFLSEEMLVPRTRLSIGSMATQIQKQSCLTLICVSSIIIFDIFLLLKDILSGL
jgi:hypothetical protein